MRSQIYQAEERWDGVVKVANTLVKQEPNLPTGWILRSYALHELRRTKEAYDLLVPAADKFPKRPVIFYNLACYACQLGQLKEAMQRLQRAIEVSGKKMQIQLDALEDPDLQPLWDKIGEL